MAPPKPHVVLIHGAWHSPPYFAKVTALLQDHLYVVHSQQLPSVGTPPSWTPPTDLTQDVSAARALFDAAIGANGNDVVVICHSWGGIVTGSALVGYTKKEREEKGLKGGVIKCGYMCAFMLDEGASLQDGGGEPPPWYDINVSLPCFPYSLCACLSMSVPRRRI
jgi:pimeloyl-ACP methyl ester carboxylesterase